jgi:hypothetical protein
LENGRILKNINILENTNEELTISINEFEEKINEMKEMETENLQLNNVLRTKEVFIKNIENSLEETQKQLDLNMNKINLIEIEKEEIYTLYEDTKEKVDNYSNQLKRLKIELKGKDKIITNLQNRITSFELENEELKRNNIIKYKKALNTQENDYKTNSTIYSSKNNFQNTDQNEPIQ